EDGIRDFHVTGVQTCALPIFLLFDFGLLAAHEALDGEDRVLRVHHRLAFGDGPDEALAALREGDDGRRRAPTLSVLEDRGLATQIGRASCRAGVQTGGSAVAL